MMPAAPSTHWALPEYIADVLPPEALRIETLRRRCWIPSAATATS